MKKFLFSLLFGSCLISAFCQTPITARIVDAETKYPIDSAVISIEGDTALFYANKLGYFQINADTSNFLIISHDDYETGTIKVPPQSSFAIQLNPLLESEVIRVSNEYEKGRIVDGYKTGIWEYYDGSNELALKIDYDRNQIIYLAPDNGPYAVEINGEFVMKEVDRQPRYLGSMSEILLTIASAIDYPEKARANGIQGNFQVAFTVGVDGRMQDFEVLNDLGQGCGAAAVSALKVVPAQWIPALIDGRPYPTRFIIPYRFEIENLPLEESGSAERDEIPVATTLDTFVVTAKVL